ncbi:N-acyl-D-amino-acid deacylase family protein [Pseudonocardia spinosispora]|uniref:N-acyl-D-amino-acid deacylase family protein n=1 Tax=Pseudonocardia spinosispora TaxID=103441 RepID=UPI000409BF23|nr:D-aminoacylase [Pseudonocardia spinosispora]
MTSEQVIRGGRVIDGTGSPPFDADVVIGGGRIVDVARAGGPVGARRVIDAEGMIVCPGFVDIHTHCDYTLPRSPRASSYLRQGVTTLVLGNCGMSPFPVRGEPYGSFLARDLDVSWESPREFLAMLAALPLGPNVAQLVGHGSIRAAVMGFAERAPSDVELTRMQRCVTEAHEAGVYGLSSGLIYAPGCYAEIEEVAALASVSARHGGFYATHLRDEGDGLLSSVEEALEIARRSGAPLQLSHHKAIGRANWGRTAQSLGLIDRARAEGLDVLSDQYPYTATSTSLEVYLPTWTLRGGSRGLRELLADPASHRTIADEIRTGHGQRDSGLRRFEPESILICGVAGTESPLSGKRLSEVRPDLDPVEVLLELLGSYGDRVEIVAFSLSEADVRRVLRHEAVCVASDGWVLGPEAGGTPHPRSYGTFPRVLGRYVRDDGVLSFEEAIRKMTSMPASRLPGADVGHLRPGARADVVVLDPERIADTATFSAPHGFAVGIRSVVVNGELVIADSEETGAAPGRVLRSRGAVRDQSAGRSR